MKEDAFWSIIELAWNKIGGYPEQRRSLVTGSASEEVGEELMEAMEELEEPLSESLNSLSKEDLLSFDRILERKLWEIDREEVQEQTDGSDDGFLYARGFIVAAGRSFYDAVNENPTVAMMDLECEDICYLPFHIYEERFGEMPGSDISRESGSNPSGWPSD